MDDMEEDQIWWKQRWLHRQQRRMDNEDRAALHEWEQRRRIYQRTVEEDEEEEFGEGVYEEGRDTEEIERIVREEMAKSEEEFMENFNEGAFDEVMGKEAAASLGFAVTERRRKRVAAKYSLRTEEDDKNLEEAMGELKDMLVLAPEGEDELDKELRGEEEEDAASVVTVVAAKEDDVGSVKSWTSEASTVKADIGCYDVVEVVDANAAAIAEREMEAAGDVYGKSRTARKNRNRKAYLELAAAGKDVPKSRRRDGGTTDLEKEEEERVEKLLEGMKKAAVTKNRKERERKKRKKEEARQKEAEEREKRKEVRSAREVERDSKKLHEGMRKMRVALEESEARAKRELEEDIEEGEREIMRRAMDDMILEKNMNVIVPSTPEEEEELNKLYEEVSAPRKQREAMKKAMEEERERLLKDVDSNTNEDRFKEIQELEALLNERETGPRDDDVTPEEYDKLPFLEKVDVYDDVQEPKTIGEKIALATMWKRDDGIGSRLNFSFQLKGVPNAADTPGLVPLMGHCANNRVSTCTWDNYIEFINSENIDDKLEGLAFHFQRVVGKIWVDGGGGTKAELEALVERERKRLGLIHFRDLPDDQKANAVKYVRAGLNEVLQMKPSLKTCLIYYMALLTAPKIDPISINSQARTYGRVGMPLLSRNERRKKHQLQDMYEKGKKHHEEGPSEAYSGATERSRIWRKRCEDVKREKEREEAEARKRDARRVIEERRIASLPRFGNPNRVIVPPVLPNQHHKLDKSYNLNENLKNLSVEQYKAYKKINDIRKVLIKEETNLYQVEGEKRGMLKRKRKVEEVAELAKSLPYPITKSRKFTVKSLGEMIDEEEEKQKQFKKEERKQKKKERSKKNKMKKKEVDGRVPKRTLKKYEKWVKKKKEKAGKPDTSSSPNAPSTTSSSSSIPEQNLHTWNRLRAKWGLSATDLTPSPGSNRPTSIEQQSNTKKNMTSSKRNTEKETSSTK